MTKPRVTNADRLSNIIEVVELGRRSGMLMVERGSSPALEQGEVYFVQGHAVYALVEGLRGRDALMVLAGWGQCRFAFELNAPVPAPNITAPQSMPPAQRSQQTGPQSNVSQQRGYAPPQSAQPVPARGAPTGFNWNTAGGRPMPRPQTPPSTPSTNGATGATGATGAYPGEQRGAFPSGAAGAPYSSAPASIPSSPSSAGASWPSNWPDSASLGGQNTSGQLSWPSPAPSASTGPFAGSGPINPYDLERLPRRTPDVRDLIAVVGAYRLSRNHRTILLLADGEHTVLDLARLTSKQPHEVIALLNDLERLGLVYYQ